MLLGAVTYNVLKDWDLETIIQKLEAAGFEAVELRTGHRHGIEPSASNEERAQVTKRFERAKVRLLSFGSTCEFQSPDAERARAGIVVAKTFIDLAHDTGAWAVKVRPNGLPKDVSAETTVDNIGAACRNSATMAPAAASRSGWKCMGATRKIRRSPPPS